MPHPGPGGPHGHGHFREMPTHTGVAYHAPGPDGQPWLHLRGPAGGPAPNWNVSSEGMQAMGSDGMLSAQDTGLGNQGGQGQAPSDQVLPETAPAGVNMGNMGGWPTDASVYYQQNPYGHNGSMQHMM